jgi:hypothetical protein
MPELGCNPQSKVCMQCGVAPAYAAPLPVSCFIQGAEQTPQTATHARNRRSYVAYVYRCLTLVSTKQQHSSAACMHRDNTGNTSRYAPHALSQGFPNAHTPWSYPTTTKNSHLRTLHVFKQSNTEHMSQYMKATWKASAGLLAVKVAQLKHAAQYSQYTAVACTT